jgi:uncharacterized membrane protein
MIRVILYTRKNCQLCDQARADLDSLRTDIPHELVEIDIDTDPILEERYKEIVPVAQVGPYKLEALFTATDLRVALAAARDGLLRSQADTAVPRKHAVNLHKGVLFLSRHWLAVFNLIIFLYVGLPFAAPLLMNAGATRTAIWIQRIYSPLCHQLAYRSWFLFGEQPAYPLESANTSLTPYGEATGLDGDDFWEAKEFNGDERIGYKVVLCQRDIAIWGGMLVGGFIFGLFRKRMKPLSILIWFLVGVLPIALDGGTQILSEFPFLSFPHRESTPFLRTATGVLFGIMNVWMAFPYIEESMNETRILVASKLAAAEKQTRTPE